MEVTQYLKDKPERNPKYRAWIKEKPCLRCGYIPSIWGGENSINPHHENEIGKAAMGGKCSDKRCVPLCDNCHTIGPNSRHKTPREKFWLWIDIEAKIIEYNEEWEELKMR